MSDRKGRRASLKMFLLGIICALLVFTLIPRAKVILELTGRVRELEQQKAELEEKKERLTQELEEADSLAAVEKIAREKLGMVKEGEKNIIQVIGD